MGKGNYTPLKSNLTSLRAKDSKSTHILALHDAGLLTKKMFSKQRATTNFLNSGLERTMKIDSLRTSYPLHH